MLISVDLFPTRLLAQDQADAEKLNLRFMVETIAEPFNTYYTRRCGLNNPLTAVFIFFQRLPSSKRYLSTFVAFDRAVGYNRREVRRDLDCLRRKNCFARLCKKDVNTVELSCSPGILRIRIA